MPSTLILGQPAGPDGAGGAFQNTVESRRAWLWDSLGAAQGVLRNFGVTGVAGQMVLEVEAASAALVGERAQDGTASLQRGYHVYTPSTTTTLISFDPASASARNDAVVAAFVDTEDGALGTGVSQVGPQIVVVTGVSGTTTPRTDAEINTWIGRGGWARLYDVPIASTDTEINVANVVDHRLMLRQKHAARLAATSNQVIPTATERELTVLTTVIRSDGDLHIAGESSFVAHSDGWRTTGLQVQWSGSAAATGLRYARIKVDGTTVAEQRIPGGISNPTLNMSTEVYMTTGQRLTYTVFQDSSGGDLSVLSGNDKTHAWVKD